MDCLQTHKKKLLVGGLLVLLAIIAAAIAIPILLNKDDGDEGVSATASTVGQWKADAAKADAAKADAAKADAAKADAAKTDAAKAAAAKAEEKDAAMEEEDDDGAEAVTADDVNVKEDEVVEADKAVPAVQGSTGGPNCVYQGRTDVIVMDAKVPQQGSEDDWATRDNGVEFRPWEGDMHRVFSAGESPPRDYRFTVTEKSRYIVSAVSSASAATEFNDMWIHFGFGQGLEFRQFRTGVIGGGGTGYYKAYQNDGANKVGIFTIDHNPHVFSTKDSLEPGTVYTLRIVGRASKFTLQRLLLQKCEGQACAGTRENRQQLKDGAWGNFAPCVDD